MIGRVRGVLIEKHPPQLLLEVGGLGYEIQAPMSTFYQLSEVGNEVTLLTHLVVREDAHTLYGFDSAVERQLFRDLIKISGVGPKLALTILSGASVADFTRCVMEGDAATLTKLPGVGKKTAERLVVEMRDRLKKDYQQSDVQATAHAAAGVLASSPVSDAVNALIALGYKASDASRMVRQIDVKGLQSEDIIRQALKAIVK
ncbi:MAG: Holliday junction branch migration protein RuvA [Gammaproteobacteria bacterium]|nr:MAG: Holliday junction branch migration protein RuvA [Gammaproteobacteria bacterium]